MTTLYLIRHCEAEGNIYRRGQGFFDGKPTKKGHRQVEALAERFKDVPIDALYSSDLSRTRTTAGAITKYHNLPVNLDPRLREINMGEWENKYWGNYCRDYPELIEALYSDPEKWYVPGAEHFSEVRARMMAVLTEIAEAHPGQTVACCSHGMAIRAFVSDVMGMRSDEMGVLMHGDNTSVSLVTYENGKFHVEFVNDCSHLPEELRSISEQPSRRDGISPNSLWLEEFDPAKEPDYYTACYAEAWKAVHGSLEKFYAETYLSAAKQHYRTDNHAIIRAMRENAPVGMIDMDTLRGADEGYGWISLCYVDAAYRRHEFGAQLLGQAVYHYRELGRTAIRLHVNEQNTAAMRFYENDGFEKIGEETGCAGKLWLLEKKL